MLDGLFPHFDAMKLWHGAEEVGDCLNLGRSRLARRVRDSGGEDGRVIVLQSLDQCTLSNTRRAGYNDGTSVEQRCSMFSVMKYNRRLKVIRACAHVVCK